MNVFLTIIFLLPLAFRYSPGGKYDPTTLVFPPFLHVWVQKATATHLKLYTKNSVKVNNPQGVAATRLDSWEDPKRAEDDDELTVYGVNAGYNMIIYNTSKSAIAFYGLNESGEKRLKQPNGITAHRSGDVYVADTGNNRVVHFFNPGKELKFVRSLTEVNAPRDVAISSDRTLYIADTGSNRIAVYRDDQFVNSWNANGDLSHPTGIAVTDASDSWSYYKDAFVIVIDQNQQRLQKFSPEGQLLASKTMASLKKLNATLAYVAIDYYSNIYVTDITNHCLHKFDRDLNYLTNFGRQGGGEKEFNEPRGLAIYKRFGQVIIAEREAVQYYWVGTDIRDVHAAVEGKPAILALTYFLTEPSYVTLEILDATKKTLAKPMENTLRFSGSRRDLFDGDWQAITSEISKQNAQNHRAVKAGNYTIRLMIKPTYSSYKKFEKTLETKVQF